MRPAGSLVKTVTPYASQVEILCRDGKTVNAKSVLSLMAAGIKCGSSIEIRCNGSDEAQCLAAAVAFVEKGA